MKQFYVETCGVSILLDAKTMEGAKNEVMEGWANGGTIQITCVEYKIIRRTRSRVNTDWRM